MGFRPVFAYELGCRWVLLDRYWTASGHTFGHSGVDGVECRGASTTTVPSDQLNGSPVRRATIRLNLPTIA